ncbi:zinc-dependent alcohol dehydrogenase [Pseudomonas huanghezhanensis]|uniref:zinc-dependent alcohol dehydrogenase n=1 Tax=Pseudomonas huanghezhanensis TaxID=3002903 RepID=UPI002286A9B1|nr:zinc-binding dehydrogenase [Pseudomonas sp. BSw22131]
MKSVVFEAPKQPVVKELPRPEIGENEVLIEMAAVGICHSDYELLDGRYIIPISYPVTPGHEWSGRIAALGKSAHGFEIGDRVTGECVVELPDALHHFGFSLDGAYSQYFKARPEWLHKLPDAVDNLTASLIEPFTCGYYAIKKAGGTDASQTVVVSGGGTIGLMAAAAAIGSGARTIVIDPIARRRDAAMKLGAEMTFDPTDGDLIAKVMAATDGVGADLVVEASGHDASLGVVFDLVREEGRIAMVGINIGRAITAQLGKIQSRNLTIVGCIGSPGVWPDAIKFLERTKLDLSPIRTHVFPLENALEALEQGRRADECIKVTITNKF